MKLFPHVAPIENKAKSEKITFIFVPGLCKDNLFNSALSFYSQTEFIFSRSSC